MHCLAGSLVDREFDVDRIFVGFFQNFHERSHSFGKRFFR